MRTAGVLLQSIVSKTRLKKTVNTIMKYAGYAEQQQVYDSNLPFIFDILNTMTKEAKELENIKK